MEGKQVETEYLAFISYRHADNTEEDRQWATWLHQQLEVYDIPADLIGSTNLRGEFVPERIYPVFRDEVSLPADADLSHAITHALDSSRILVVLCSPRAVQSRYVNEEILHFKRTGKQNQIMAALILGEPNASIDDAKLEDLDDANTLECFPEALQYHLTSGGELDTTKPTEPIAANFRLPDGDEGITNPQVYKQLLLTQGRKKTDAERLANAYEEQLNTAKLKIIAGILGVRLEQLTQRDKLYQLNKAKAASKRFMRIACLMTVLAVVAVIGGGVAYTQWQRAEVLLVQIRNNLDFMNHDLHKVLNDYVPQDKRISVMQKIDVMVDVLQTSSSGQTIEDQRETAVALLQKADLIVSNNSLDPAEALPLYEKGKDILVALRKQYPMYTQFQRDVSSSHERLGGLQLRLGQTEDALMHFKASLEMMEALLKQDPTNSQYQSDVSRSQMMLGSALLRVGGQHEAVLIHFEASLVINEKLIKEDPANIELQLLLSYSHKKIGRFKLLTHKNYAALIHFEASLEINKSLVKNDPANISFRIELGRTHEYLGDALLSRKQTKEALTSYEASLSILETLVKQDPMNTSFQNGEARLHDKIGEIQLGLEKTDAALTHLEISLAMRKILAEHDPTNTFIQNDMTVTHELVGDVQLRLGKTEAALAHYEISLAMRDALAKQDPMDMPFRRGVSVLHGKISETYSLTKSYMQALDHKFQQQKVMLKLKSEGVIADDLWYFYLLDVEIRVLKKKIAS